MEEKTASVRQINRSREEQGDYVLVNKWEVDEEQHFRYFRMSKYRFDDLLRQITPHIQHQNTHSNSAWVLQSTAVALQIWIHQCVC